MDSTATLNIPFIPSEIKTRVAIAPAKIDRRLDRTITDALRKRFEGKCMTSDGYVKRNSIKLLRRSVGQITDSHFTGQVAFDVSFAAQVCLPFANQVVVAKVKNSNDVGLLAVNEPLHIIIARSNNRDEQSMKLMQKVKPGDYVEVRVLQFRLLQNNILVVGRLLRQIDEAEVINILNVKLPEFSLSNGLQFGLELGPPALTAELNPLAESVIKGKDDLALTEKTMNIPGYFSDMASLAVNPFELVWSKPEYNGPAGRTVIRVDDKLVAGISDEKINRPVNRAYFKMWEMLAQFRLVDDNGLGAKPLQFVHLAEGPGGFIQACVNRRQRVAPEAHLRDRHYAVTLKTEEVHTTWEQKEFKKFVEGEIHRRQAIGGANPFELDYGTDGTGDLTSAENVAGLRRRFAGKADIITADGGIDSSEDFSNQELLNARLIFSEIISILNCQAPDGSAVIKIYDIDHWLTFQLVQLLAGHYGDVNIYKPETSRVLNSEKYLVCRGFRPSQSDSLVTELTALLEQWNEFYEATKGQPKDERQYVVGIRLPLPQEDPQFFDAVYNYNDRYAIRQRQYIQDARDMMFSRDLLKRDFTDKVKKAQNERAIAWAQQFGLPYRSDPLPLSHQRSRT